MWHVRLQERRRRQSDARAMESQLQQARARCQDLEREQLALLSGEKTAGALGSSGSSIARAAAAAGAGSVGAGGAGAGFERLLADEQRHRAELGTYLDKLRNL